MCNSLEQIYEQRYELTLPVEVAGYVYLALAVLDGCL